VALNLRHATKAQLLAAFRARYAQSTKGQTARYAMWALYHMDLGDIDSEELRLLFGVPKPNWNRLIARWRALIDDYAAVEAARGE
jgi:hypothetical protein